MANLDAILKVTTKGDASGLAPLTRGLQQVRAMGQQVDQGLGGIGTILGGLTGGILALGAGISAAGLAAFAKSAIDAADNMRDLSQRTGASVETLSKFQQIAVQSGTDIDAVGGAMVRLSRGMSEAAETGKGPAAEALRTLGISAVDASGKLLGTDEVMLQVADRFQRMPDGAQKAALAVQLFGKSGAEMIPMLNEGRQAIESLDAAMSTAFAEKADEYNDSLAALGVVFGQIGIAIADELLPYLSSAVDWLTKVGIAFRDYIVANREPIRQTIETIGRIATAIGPWVIGIGLVIAAYKALTLATKAWATASAVAQAFAGPKGWAALAVGIGLAAGATYAVSKAMEGARGAASDAEVESRKLAAGLNTTAQAAAAVEPEINQAKQEQQAFNAAIEQSNARYKLLGETIDATGQAIQGQQRLRDATLTADLAVNNAAKSILEAKLAQSQTDEEKIPILREIQGIELENARLQRHAAAEQIAAEVRITDLKRQKAWQELRSAEAALATAAAYGQQTAKLQEQVNLMKVAANSADAEFRLQQKIAAERQRANEATFQAQQTQILNSRQAPAFSQSAPVIGPQMVNGLPVINGRIGMRVNGVPTYAGGGFTGNAPRSGGLDGRGGFMAMLHPRETIVDHTQAGPTLAPQITIRTGPILQQPDGSQWVSMGDLEQAMQATATAVARQLRSPSGRLAMGA